MPKYLVEREIPNAEKMSSEELHRFLQKSSGVLRNLGSGIQWLTGYVTSDRIYCIYFDPADDDLTVERASLTGFPVKRISKIEASLGAKSGKRIFVPTGHREVLFGWLLHLHKGRQRHDWAARRLERRRGWIGGTAAVLSGLVGAAVFTALENASSSNYVKIPIVMTSMAAAIFASLTTFLNLAERAEKHRAAGVQYKNLIREIERKFGGEDSSPPDSDVENLENRLNEMEKTAPIVPEDIYVKVDNQWNTKGVEAVTTAVQLYEPEDAPPFWWRKLWR